MNQTPAGRGFSGGQLGTTLGLLLFLLLHLLPLLLHLLPLLLSLMRQLLLLLLLRLPPLGHVTPLHTVAWVWQSPRSVEPSSTAPYFAVGERKRREKRRLSRILLCS